MAGVRGDNMLTIEEIRTFINEDDASPLKARAKEGDKYYNGIHDILEYRMFYWNADGNLVEDKTRSNVKIPHPFFTELVDQGTQHILSGEDGIFHSNDTGLQKWLDLYFNKNRAFKAELSETITGQQAKGFDYMYAYKGKDDRLVFENADCLGVVEVEGRFAADGKDQRIYRYVDRIDKDGHTQWKILVIDDEFTHYYCQTDDGEIKEDTDVKINPKPHDLYKDKDGKLYTKTDGLKFLPFFRLDMNKKRVGLLAAVKRLIDDYDIHASSLTNNLIDFDTPLHVVKGFEGDNLDELQQNLKTKKMVGVSEDGGIEVHTVEIPYQARVAKLELDEKCIYKFGMGLNLAGMKDTAATTNIAIKSAYSLLELRCKKMQEQLEKFLEEILTVVLAEINSKEKTAYTVDQVDFVFAPEIMANEQENAQIELIEAQKQQTQSTTLLNLAAHLDDETLMKQVCDILGLDYEEIKDKLPQQEEVNDPAAAQKILNGIVPEDGAGGDVIE